MPERRTPVTPTSSCLNDLVLQDRTGVLPGNAELDALRRRLYDEAVAGP